MDGVVRTYLYGAIIVAILFFVFTSDVIYWLFNRMSVAVSGPAMYSYTKGGPTLSGRVLMSVLFFAVIFGVIDYIYTTLNGDDTPAVE